MYDPTPRKPHGSHDPHAGGAITVWRIFHTTQDHDAYGFAFLDED